ncbi:hypothetical protein ABZ445_16185 [Streptomyces chartreusis]|uniref:hypothetical protein n=1 Tax=Streptomyces chartreusis TaxID=1969 RepID=UPI00340C3153
MADWAQMVANRDAEIERLKELLQYEHNRANSAIDREETAEKAAEELREERDRYRSAWLSARRRAADEANFGMEALDRERARQASYVRELQPLIKGRMDEVQRLRAFANEVRLILGWTHVDGNWMTLHSPALHEARHELDEAQKENRPFVDRNGRRAARGEFDEGYPIEADEAP